MTTTIPTTALPAELLEAEEAANAASARYAASLVRIDGLQARRAELSAAIARELDDKHAEKLRRERRDIAADLEQAPADTVALAELYAQRLLNWAVDVEGWAQQEIALVNTERAQPAAAMASARARLSPSRPADSLSPTEQAAAEATLNSYVGPVAALTARGQTATTYHDAARCRAAAIGGDRCPTPASPR